MTLLKQKGDLAEMKVAAHLLGLGHHVCIPFGDSRPYDLVLERAGHLERVQVKHANSDGETIAVRCYTQSITAARVVSIHRYTDADIEWLAVWDAATDTVIYIAASELHGGRRLLNVRYRPCSYNRVKDVRLVDEHRTPELALAAADRRRVDATLNH